MLLCVTNVIANVTNLIGERFSMYYIEIGKFSLLLINETCHINSYPLQSFLKSF